MPGVDRMLLRRRHAVAADEPLARVVQQFRANNPRTSTQLITRAYEAAERAHADQTRDSGERYITHPVAVARVVADIGLDDTTIAAALLHDAVEDTALTVSDLEREFGSEVAAIVDGVTKLERLQFDSREEQQAATMRKMLVAMARDLRVLIIKLADRLHNLRTIAGLPHDKQARIAQETLDIYAPLAHRLGMQEIKQELEDLAFAALHPKRYAEIDHLVAMRTSGRDQYLAKVVAEVEARLAEVRIDADVTGRGKHLWSIYEKMIVKGREFDDIFDLMGIRVIVDSVKDCYAALGCIHGTWKPVVGRFKDYVAMPKFNLYQSLHTTVIGPEGKALEVQIRSREMHQRAEWGVAAHWQYKHGTTHDDLAWLNRLIDWQAEVRDPEQFMEALKTDLQQDEVFVFTPRGKIVTLPLGSTPIDFAYAVHTEVGHACIGARINGRLVPLDHRLHSGDTCEIFTSKVERAGPSRDWLQIVRSPRARNKIRQWFSRERRDDAIEAGREELVSELRREGMPAQKVLTSDALATLAKELHYIDLESLLLSIGEHHVSGRSVAQRLGRVMRSGETDEVVPTTIRRTRRQTREIGHAGIHVEGLDDVLVRLSRCCTPVPGDEIVGFITRGRGVSVHRSDCSNAVGLAVEQAVRMIEVEWDGDSAGALFRALVEVKALDRSRLLRDVANELADHHVNIVACSTSTASDRIATMRFEFETADPSHLEAVVRTIKSIDGVYDAYRILPGKAKA